MREDEEIVHGFFFFFQAEDGIRGLVRSRGLGDVYKRQVYDGFVADSAITVPVGEVAENIDQLLQVTEEAVFIGAAKMVAGNRVGDVSAAIQDYVESHSLQVTREYTGHGVGRQMHEGPQVPNYGTPGRGMMLRVGMTIALEPMVLIDSPSTRVLNDQWTVVSRNGLPTAHFEHTIAITADGPWILTLLENGESPGRIKQVKV